MSGAEAILVVDDDDSIRSVVVDFLLEAGYSVLSARSGEEALREAGSLTQVIDLLITDGVMPGMSGSTLVRQLRPRCVLFVSGYDEADVFARAGQLQDRPAFLQKPFKGRELLRKVRETLDSAARKA